MIISNIKEVSCKRFGLDYWFNHRSLQSLAASSYIKLRKGEEKQTVCSYQYIAAVMYDDTLHCRRKNLCRYFCKLLAQKEALK